MISISFVAAILREESAYARKHNGKDNRQNKVCTYLASNSINVLDISQTIVQDFFNMMMIVDMSTSAKPFADCVKELEQIGEEIGVKIKCQREEIFDMMHRI